MNIISVLNGGVLKTTRPALNRKAISDLTNLSFFLCSSVLLLYNPQVIQTWRNRVSIA